MQATTDGLVLKVFVSVWLGQDSQLTRTDRKASGDIVREAEWASTDETHGSTRAYPLERFKWRATRVEILTELLARACVVSLHRFRHCVDKRLERS
jgi:hypothetical protein